MPLTSVVVAEKEQDDMNNVWLWRHLSLGRSEVWKSRKETPPNFSLCSGSGWSSAQPIGKLAGNSFAWNYVINLLKRYFIRNLGLSFQILAWNRKVWLHPFLVRKVLVSHCIEMNKIVFIWVCHNVSFCHYSVMTRIQFWFVGFHCEGSSLVHLHEQLTPLKLLNP